MPEKHNDVGRFIEHDLPDAVEEALAHFFDGRWMMLFHLRERRGSSCQAK